LRLMLGFGAQFLACVAQMLQDPSHGCVRIDGKGNKPMRISRLSKRMLSETQTEAIMDWDDYFRQ
jgi:hypothetical protein